MGLRQTFSGVKVMIKKEFVMNVQQKMRNVEQVIN